MGQDNSYATANGRNAEPSNGHIASLDASNIGKVGVNSTGKVGVIFGIKQLPFGVAYVGIAYEDNTRWASRNPVIIADSIKEFVSKRELNAWRRGRDGIDLNEPPIGRLLALASMN